MTQGLPDSQADPDFSTLPSGDRNVMASSRPTHIAGVSHKAGYTNQ